MASTPSNKNCFTSFFPFHIHTVLFLHFILLQKDSLRFPLLIILPVFCLSLIVSEMSSFPRGGVHHQTQGIIHPIAVSTSFTRWMLE